jgi:rfaE bifunctional protein nucleotidyltransferase chain/domain
MNVADAVDAPAGRKVVALRDLAELCESARHAGKRIVHCHGVFDLLHVGHLRHFMTAKGWGDVLVVSITADEFVNKGPGRPAFAADMRSEMLAALACVDWVTVVHDHSAEPAIEAVRADIYVKGGEYDDPEKDITGKISREQELVEAHGGQVKFTYDVTYSSSNLLNSHFKLFDDAAHSYLSLLRDIDAGKKIFRYIEKIEKLKVVIVGETIIDHYVYVAPMGKAPKENMIATLHQNEEIFAGGVIAAANHLSAICPHLEVVTLLGDPAVGDNFEDFIRRQLRTRTQPEFIYRPTGPTIQKTRFVEPTYVRKLFEVYRMDDRPLPEDTQKELRARLRERIRGADLVVVCDFGHGFIDKSVVSVLTEEAKFLAVNVQTNAGNLGYNLLTKYPRADFLCIDAMEARLVSQDKHLALEEVVGRVIPSMISCPNVIVTHGKAGCYTFDQKRKGILHAPAFRQDIVDTVGAGDAFFALAAPFAALGAESEIVSFIGNIAGAMKVGVVGHRESTTKLQLLRYITTLLK